jgi:transposase
MQVIETPVVIVTSEQIDDVPLLVALLQKMGVAQLLDKYFPAHGNWQGLSLGNVVVLWLTYILSQGDHRLNALQGWVAKLLETLKFYMGFPNLRELDCSDDRLGIVLERLGKDDAAWEAFEQEHTATLLRVYDLDAKRVRIDSTTMKSYTEVKDGGLFQFGYSKENRPDLPQIKINQAVLDPLGMPLSVSIVSGECADDPLYVPEIRKVQASLGKHGVLYVGDCKMASLETRAYIASSKDHYLCPLPSVQMSAADLKAILAPVWTGVQPLTAVQRAPVTAPDKPVHIADGFSYQVTMKIGDIEWQENRLAVKSLKHAKAKQKALDNHLQKAEQEIAALNLRGRGRKNRTQEETQTEVNAILKRQDVVGLLNIDYKIESKTTHKRGYFGQPGQDITTVNVTVCTERNDMAYKEAVQYLGWRVYVCNDPGMSMEDAVLAYREEYIIERGFNRFRGEKLCMTPLFLNSTTRIKGLIRLLSIGLRALCLVEHTVRDALREKNEKLDQIYEGNPKRATDRPTTEMMLKAFRGINRVVVNINETVKHISVTPLNTVQVRILGLLGMPLTIYQGFGAKCQEAAFEMSEP